MLLTPRQERAKHKDIVAEFRLFYRGRGWTQTYAARQLSVSQPYLSALESDDEVPTREMVSRMVYLLMVLQ